MTYALRNLARIFAALAMVILSPLASARDGVPTPIDGGELDRSVFVPMRDGVRLATDIYLPARDHSALGTVVLRTPYRKGNDENIRWAHFFAKEGFAVVVQDVRGRWESEGSYDFYATDQNDFADTASWIAQQPWSNARVGTFGCSYLGEVQVIQASGRSAHLKAMLPVASSGGSGSANGRYRYFSGTMGGAYELLAAYSWFSSAGSTIYAKLDPDLERETYLGWIDAFDQYPRIPRLTADEKEALLRSLPVLGMIDRGGFAPSQFDTFISVPLGDPSWERRGFLSENSQVDTPSLFVNGWYDYGPGETLSQYRFFRDRALSTSARANQYLIMSPATHCRDAEISEKEDAVVGERPMGDTRFPLRAIYSAWFDHWLNRDGEGTLPIDRVHYYLMGANRWQVAQDMPIPGTRFTPYYLGTDGQFANGSAGGGILSLTPPGAQSKASSSYLYDPENPSLIIGGPLCCDLDGRKAGAYDQQAAQVQDDVLVFTSEPMEQPLEVTGPLKLVLYVESDAPDTDFYAKLTDVHPDGTAYWLQEGILRARYREGFDQQVPMHKGEVYRIEIDLQATSNLFRTGHRIRLEIASSHFPRFDRNLNTGGEQITETIGRIAHNRVYHSQERASHLLLPVIPAGASKPFDAKVLEARLEITDE